jgi:hypothetical protein
MGKVGYFSRIFLMKTGDKGNASSPLNNTLKLQQESRETRSDEIKQDQWIFLKVFLRIFCIYYICIPTRPW